MSLHPNWIALATIDFPRKIFIQEGQSSIQDVKFKTPIKETLNGNVIKDFYLDVLSTPSTNVISTYRDTIKTKKNKKTLPHDILNATEERRTSIFLNSAQNKNTDLVRQILLKFPLIINSTDNYGWTALMCAVKSNAVEVVKCLLEHKADKYLKEKGGKSAFSLAEPGSLTEKLLLLNITNCDKTKNLTNEENRENLYCEKCREYYSTDDRKKHLSSTMHIFQSGKREAPTYYGIPENNKGFQLLLKTGWNSEMGLGINGEGSRYPVKSVLKIDRYGLGNKVGKPKVTHFFANDVRAIKHRSESIRTFNKKQHEKRLLIDKNSERYIRCELS